MSVRPFHIYCPIFARFGVGNLNIFVSFAKISKGKAVLFLGGCKSNYFYAPYRETVWQLQSKGAFLTSAYCDAGYVVGGVAW
jgi:hypothetical protein